LITEVETGRGVALALEAAVGVARATKGNVTPAREKNFAKSCGKHLFK
jgi:hypothetical protein